MGEDNARYRLVRWLTLIGSCLAAMLALWINNYLLLVFFLGFLFYYAYQLYRTRDISLDTAIPYVRVQRVEYHAAEEGKARGYMVVFYVDEKGKTKRRFLVLPSITAGGREAAQTAQYLFRQVGLQVHIPVA